MLRATVPESVGTPGKVVPRLGKGGLTLRAAATPAQSRQSISRKAIGGIRISNLGLDPVAI